MNSVVFILSVATIIRLIVTFVLFPSNDATTDHDNILTHALGPGILPAIRAAISDPVHSWDHLEEACFWGSVGGGIGSGMRYSSIYVPGTRIVAPPLVVTFLGETLVCSRSVFMQLVQKLLLLIADAIGAYCIYHVGQRVFEMETWSNEAEMERHTKLSEMKKENRVGKFNDDLIVPGVLLPEKGWIVGLSSKIIPNEESVIDETVKNGASAADDDNQQKLGDRNDDNTNDIDTVHPSSVDRKPIIALDQLPMVISLMYYCNPIAMLANATGSIRSLWDALLLLSFYYATMPSIIIKEGIPIKLPSATKAACSLALATYVDVWYGVFLVPILLWRGVVRGAQTPATIQRGQHRDWKTMLLLYLSYFGGLHLFASLLVGGDPGTYKNVLVQTMLPNVAFVQEDDSGSVPGPSMGLHWYMFVQMFDRFRPYFTVFVSGVPSMFVIPLMARLHRYPSVLTAAFQLLWAIFRPTTTVHTLTLGLHLALLNPRTIVRMRNPSLISLFALPVPILLFMTFHRMWLVSGNGNPNYIYFQCFAYGLFVTIITMDFVSATVKRDKVRRMVEKGTVKKLAKKKEEAVDSQKKSEKVGENDEHNLAEILEKYNGGVDLKVPEDIGNISDQEIDDARRKPEPTTVFL
ncbi:hypothetical protein ACHAXR_006391 [Thalassiosira sp. AJA248-18]